MSDVIAHGHADQVIEGKHCHRSIRLHRQDFEALLRYRIKSALSKDKLSHKFQRKIVNLKLDQTTTNLNSSTESPEFQPMVKKLTDALAHKLKF